MYRVDQRFGMTVLSALCYLYHQDLRIYFFNVDQCHLYICICHRNLVLILWILISVYLPNLYLVNGSNRYAPYTVAVLI